MLCLGLFVIFLHRLPHVEMVRRMHDLQKISASADVWCRLINYTPQATIVRLLTINAINAYITSGVLTLAGGFEDPRLLLPGWVGIATVSNSTLGYCTVTWK